MPQTSEFDKYFPPDFSIDTLRVTIRPMNMEDYNAFAPLTQQSDTWTYFTKDLSKPEQLKVWMEEGMQEKVAGKRMPFTVIDRDTKEICGGTSYGNISFYDRRVEIGWSWLGPKYIGMGVNKSVKFALLSYAFEVMKMERVEAKTDVLNERAKAGLLKVGMIPEGILRSHMLMHSGRRRDTLYFSLLRNEWPERKRQFFAELM